MEATQQLPLRASWLEAYHLQTPLDIMDDGAYITVCFGKSGLLMKDDDDDEVFMGGLTPIASTVITIEKNKIRSGLLKNICMDSHDSEIKMTSNHSLDIELVISQRNVL
jgi:hypothetical protein